MSSLNELADRGRQRANDITYDEHTGIFTLRLEAKAKRKNGWPIAMSNLLIKAGRRVPEPYVLLDIKNFRSDTRGGWLYVAAEIRLITNRELKARKKGNT